MKELDCIFRPKSIAVIGASNNPGTINSAMFMNLIMGNFKGPVFPINPKYNYVHGIKSYNSISEVPDQVDLAVIMVPRDAVFGVVDRCGEKGVKGLIVITAGFKETGMDGSELETRLVEKVRSYGMRMIGPNCFGVMNLGADVCMNATFSAYTPTTGKVAFMSQSGGLGEILIDRAERESLGVAQFASIGNKADVGGNDLLEYWQDDPNINAILMYLENIGEPRKFGQLARKISRTKPLITLKAGRTARGAAAASSHTGALADQDAANTAMFEQYGVIQVNSVESLFKVGSLIVNQPRPKGRNVAVITNAGGPGILMTDALVSHGLNVPEISKEKQEKMREVLRPETSVHNPIDVIASGGPDDYRAALDALYNDDDIHSIVVLFIPVTIIDAMAVAEVLVEFAQKGEKPVQVVWLARGKIHGEEAEALLRKNLVPMYEMPLDAAEALALATQYTEWLGKPVGRVPMVSMDTQSARNIIENVITDGRQSLEDKESFDLLRQYGLPVLPTVWIKNVDDALAAASDLSYPVVLKASAPGLHHKTEIGGVELDIENSDDLVASFEKISSNLEKHGLKSDSTILVQPMIEIKDGAVECVLGLRNLKKYGPMLMFGIGGIFIEILKAVEFRMVPLTDTDARELIKDSPAWPILKGARGRPPVDFDALVNNILRLSQMAFEIPEISEVDLNPFVAFPDGSKNVALDQVIIL